MICGKAKEGRKGKTRSFSPSSNPVAFDPENGNDGQPMDGWVDDKLFIIS